MSLRKKSSTTPQSSSHSSESSDEEIQTSSLRTIIPLKPTTIKIENDDDAILADNECVSGNDSDDANDDDDDKNDVIIQQHSPNSFSIINQTINMQIKADIQNASKESLLAKIKQRKLKEKIRKDPNSACCDENIEDDLREFEYENYRIWKKNCPFLYNLLITNSVEWPSTTVQWYSYCKPQVQSNQKMWNNSYQSNFREFVSERILLGTQTEPPEKNYVIIATQYMPLIDQEQIFACEGGVSLVKYAKFENYVRIIHEGDVNRARYNPQNPFIIATCSSNSKNYLFDYSKHPCEPSSDEFKPDLILNHHSKEGFGICWNNRKHNILATCASDSYISIWDINGNTQEPKTLQPKMAFKAHDDEGCNDVQWHHQHDTYLGSVGNDKMLRFWDIRMNCKTKSIFQGRVHDAIINTLSFNPFCEYIVLTASDDHTVALFDIRNLKHRLHSFHGHKDEVLDVKWSTYCETIFASSGRDKRLIIWDMTKINAAQSQEDAVEGPPEMIFIHGGHTGIIQDFSWHQHNQMIASVSHMNEIHVFKPGIDA
ncbi:putative histone-binding protein lin-53 [Sarcoptes scabiei]|nr:putative histone-binding protein lin-53 [Sarcoptes scabiei]